MITGLAITRERERGTMENLLSMPTRPLEVLLGKIVPYILVGYVQSALILAGGAVALSTCPWSAACRCCSWWPCVFIAANLAMGVTFSTVAKNQLQAVQMAFSSRSRRPGLYFSVSRRVKTNATLIMLLFFIVFPSVSLNAVVKKLVYILPLLLVYSYRLRITKI